MNHHHVVLLSITLFSFNAMAGVYKCTDSQGNTAYQSSPCAQEKTALEINMKTGGTTDLAVELNQKKADLELKKQQQEEEKLKQQLEAKRLADTAAQSALNQQLIKDNTIQFSAFAIPPYQPDKLPALVKPFAKRLPEVEKFRRLAAQKALATGECKRVESDELSINSKPDEIVISVDCSSAKTFYFNEHELTN